MRTARHSLAVPGAAPAPPRRPGPGARAAAAAADGPPEAPSRAAMMRGAPPPPALHVDCRSRQDSAAKKAWSVHHMRELGGSQRLEHGGLAAPAVPLAPCAAPPPAAALAPLQALSRHPDTDAVILLHDGRLLAETYRNGAAVGTRHWLASLSRSLTASAVGVLVGAGAMDVAAPIEAYVPELAAAGFGGASVRQLLDMRSGVASSVPQMYQALRWLPAAADVPYGMYAYLQALPRTQPHGGPFAYRSADTDVLGWACERVTGEPMGRVLGELVWKPLRPEYEADLVLDPLGAPLFCGGVCAAARDVARFGQMLLDGGTAHGREVLPAAWVADLRHGDAEVRAAFGGKFFGRPLPGGMFRGQMWGLDPARGITLAYGAHGQMLYVDPTARLVGVVLSAWEAPHGPLADAWLTALGTVAEALRSNDDDGGRGPEEPPC